MKILFVSPNVPSPIRPRPYQFIKALAQRHEVHLVCLVTSAYERRYLADLTEICARVTPVSHSRRRGAINCLAALPRRQPLRFLYFYSPKLASVVRDAQRAERYDLVHIEHAKTAISVPETLNVPSVFDAVDCVSILLDRQAQQMARGWRRVLVRVEADRTRKTEASLIRRFPRVICVSGADAESLRALGATNVTQVPIGVDSGVFKPGARRDPDTVVFAAKLDYFPNAQAAHYLVDKVMPTVWSRLPHVRVQIVGNRPPRSVQALAVDPRVVVTGFVPDVAAYLASATVAVAPILVKAGMQFKILEAMAAGAPVVATGMAAAGLDALPGRDLIVADDPLLFGEGIVELLEESTRWQEISSAGRLVAGRYSWVAAVAKLEEVYAATTQFSVAT